MKKLLKLAGLALAVVLGLAGVGVAGLYAWSSGEIGHKLPVPTHAFVAPTDAASVARGGHVMNALAKCSECHGPDLGGAAILEDPAIGYLYAPNLTRGQGGIGADYDDASFERAVRHGVARDGRRLKVMPSNEYQFMSDEDLGTVIAYIKSLPAVDRVTPASRVGPLGRALFAAGELPLFAADEVQHRDGVVPAVRIDSTVDYGRYLATIGCSGCHGATYGGGPIHGAPPDWPPAANLTPTGIGHYTFDTFATALKTGVRPGGTAINARMPIQATKEMTELELKAVWNFLQTVQPREFGTH